MFLWWPWTARFPWSGDVQDISPLTNWFSPQVEFNFAGDRRIEADVVSNIASYGKQLGILSEAVEVLAEGNDDPKIQRLRDLVKQVEGRKRQHREDLRSGAEAALRRLGELEPEALDELVAEFSRRPARKTETAARSAA